MAVKKNPTYTVTKLSAAELKAVKPHIVDKIIRWAQEENYCEVVGNALSHVFGKAPAAGWRDSEGFDCYGFGVDKLNRLGFNEDGYDAEGYNENGWNAQGLDKEGYNRRGYDRQGYDREGFDYSGFNKDGVSPDGRTRTELESFLAGLTREQKAWLVTRLRREY